MIFSEVLCWIEVWYVSIFLKLEQHKGLEVHETVFLVFCFVYVWGGGGGGGGGGGEDLALGFLSRNCHN